MLRPIFKIPRVRIFRHAPSKWNESGQVQGCLPDPRITLTEAGFASVQSILANEIKPNILISSPLIRCKQTAAAWYGVPFEQLPVRTQIVPDIREIHAGDYEGLFIKDLKHDALWKKWMTDPMHFPGFPGGENLDQFSKRVLRGVGAICTQYPYPNQQIGMFTHGVVMRVLKCFLAEQDLSHLWTYKVENLEQIALSDEQILKFQNYYQQCVIKDAIFSPK